MRHVPTFLSWRELMEDDGRVHTVRGKHACRELAQDPRVGEAVQAVPDREHVE